MRDIFKKLLNEPITKEQTEKLISSFLSEETSEAQIGAYLFATANRKIT